MSGFKIIQKIDENMKTRIQIEGAMDEHSDYSSIEKTFTDSVVFDFDKVEHINSTGIKHWVQWVTAIVDSYPNLNFSFINCPKPIVDQINMVEGFLPRNSIVKSFKVPYYCEECEKDAIYIFVLGREYKTEDGKTSIEAPTYPCKCSEPNLEPDVIEQKYFRFLSK